MSLTGTRLQFTDLEHLLTPQPVNRQVLLKLGVGLAIGYLCIRRLSGSDPGTSEHQLHADLEERPLALGARVQRWVAFFSRGAPVEDGEVRQGDAMAM